jgi:hypothetical protein
MPIITTERYRITKRYGSLALLIPAPLAGARP